MRIFVTFFFLLTAAHAEPLLTSWFLDGSRQYARMYGDQPDVDSQTTYTTWSHPDNGTGQDVPTYAGIHEISYDADFVYVRSSGLGTHIMGPWWRNNETRANIFGNWPGSYAYIM
ncbi:MAG: hypothetical protein AAF492_06105, partial [Verrucomicrobiota bacterium]